MTLIRGAIVCSPSIKSEWVCNMLIGMHIPEGCRRYPPPGDDQLAGKLLGYQQRLARNPATHTLMLLSGVTVVGVLGLVIVGYGPMSSVDSFALLFLPSDSSSGA